MISKMAYHHENLMLYITADIRRNTFARARRRRIVHKRTRLQNVWMNNLWLTEFFNVFDFEALRGGGAGTRNSPNVASVRLAVRVVGGG
jgi:hypothetical protein